MKGIINSPQFDTKVFEIGKAIKIDRYNYRRNIVETFNALIKGVNPLEIEIIFINKQKVYEYKTIPIQKVIDGEAEGIVITFLVPESDGK